MSTLRTGGEVRVVARKWPDRPHWEHDALWLGTDEHGIWLGAARGTAFARPGVAFVSSQDQVRLVPNDAGFMAEFYAPGGNAPFDVYVDVTTVPRWSGDVLTVVDLDLDVVRGWSGRVWVDDEDEFARHRVEHGYPDDVVRLAVTTCEQVQALVSGRRAPYDGTAQTWFARLSELTRSAGGTR